MIDKIRYRRAGLASLVWAAALIVLVAAGTAMAGDNSGMPPDIQKIMQKLQSGQQMSPAEQKRLSAYSAGLSDIKPPANLPEARGDDDDPTNSTGKSCPTPQHGANKHSAAPAAC